MASRSVITVTTGEAGSGKSYARCALFIQRFLRDHDGVHWSNFPVGEVPEDHSFPPKDDEPDGVTFRQRIARRASRLYKLDEAECVDRIQMIPKAELDRWESGDSGPWEFFEGKSLQDAHVAIDEIHNYCDAQGDTKLRKRWKQWLGEIRHQGATVEFLSQALQKVPLEIRREAGLHIVVKNTETERDPAFKIELGDWYELRAGFVTGRYSSNVMEQERRSAMGDARGGWMARRIFPLDPWNFSLYDSYSTPQKDGNKGRAQRRQFEKRSRVGLLAWFVSTNAGRLIPRGAFFVAIAWLMFGQYVGLGGGPWVMKKAIARVQSYGTDASDVALAGFASGGSHGESTEETSAAAAPQLEEDVLDLGTGTAVDLASTPEEVTAAVLQLRARLEELEAENAILRGYLDRSAELTAISPTSATLRNGFTYQLGETIDYGEFDGAVLEEILWRQRAARLDDGTILRMGTRDDGPLSDELLQSARADE
ncbi:MAG: zonular occludens toxin domain-containing protein [Planctomycetota bacterium]